MGNPDYSEISAEARAQRPAERGFSPLWRGIPPPGPGFLTTKARRHEGTAPASSIALIPRVGRNSPPFFVHFVPLWLDSRDCKGSRAQAVGDQRARGGSLSAKRDPFDKAKTGRCGLRCAGGGRRLALPDTPSVACGRPRGVTGLRAPRVARRR